VCVTVFLNYEPTFKRQMLTSRNKEAIKHSKPLEFL
jgi:hypothetical protein